MSRYTIEANKYLVVVGWDDGLQSFFGQVWTLPEGDDTDEPPELWVGASWEEMPTAQALAEDLEAYVTIPEDVIKKLEDDYRGRRPLADWQRHEAVRFLFTSPKHRAC